MKKVSPVYYELEMYSYDLIDGSFIERFFSLKNAKQSLLEHLKQNKYDYYHYKISKVIYIKPQEKYYA